MSKHKCDNCSKVFEDDQIRELWDTPDLHERLDPGGEVPSGECKECGALCYIIKSQEERLARIHIANSYAGDVTGELAVALHQAASQIGIVRRTIEGTKNAD